MHCAECGCTKKLDVDSEQQCLSDQWNLHYALSASQSLDLSSHILCSMFAQRGRIDRIERADYHFKS